MGNLLVMSSSFRASQSTLAFATKMGWKPSATIFHFWILQVTSQDKGPMATSARWSRMTGFLASQVSLDGLYDRETPNWQPGNHTGYSSSHGSKPITETGQGTVFLLQSTRLLSFPRNDCPLFYRSLLPTHLQHVAVPLTCWVDVWRPS